MGKAFYSWSIGRDPAMAGTQVRCTTIPEELGRISYLLSDKTGTLTQNTMVLKRLHLGTVSYVQDSFDEVRHYGVLFSSGFRKNYFLDFQELNGLHSWWIYKVNGHSLKTKTLC